MLLSSMQVVSLASVQTETKCYKLCYLTRAIPLPEQTEAQNSSSELLGSEELIRKQALG